MDAELYYKLKSKELTLAELTDQYGNALRKLIWDPLAEHFRGADTIIVSPSMHLVACPFAALPTSKGNSFLIEQFAFASLATPRLLPELLADREPTQVTKLLLVGDIDYNSSSSPAFGLKKRTGAGESREFFKKLPAANLELGPIRDAFVERYKDLDIKQLRGKHATEAKVRQQIIGAQFIHFDTHGFCLQENDLLRLKGLSSSSSTESSSPLLSGVALTGGNHGLLATTSTHTDGILWADEIGELDLHEADLVTLSACQTAVGRIVPGEGMLRAQRALYVAGARSSLAALWVVEGRSTKTLMSNFYKQLWNRKLSKSKALQQAMIYMLRHYQGNDTDTRKSQSLQRTPPALWAGFVLHGDWR